MKFERLDKMLGIAMKAAIWCIIVLVFAVALSGCGNMDPYVRAGAGHIPNHDISGTGGVAFKSDVGMQGKHHHCEWSHISMINRGYPFDSRAEPSINWIGCGVQFGGK